MTPTEQRVSDLLDRWLASVEIHARYVELDDAAYADVQTWPKHQRPTRWVVNLARTRLIELRRLCAERRLRGDRGFADALELMGFLANLVGLEHVERFIPLAALPTETTSPPPADARPAPAAAVAAPPPPPAPAHPKSTVADERLAHAAPTDRRKVSVRPKPAAAGAPAVPPVPEPAATIPEATVAMVVADAVRFLSWGRDWPQLASSIARLADRPPEADVWKILRQHRSAIEAKALRRPN